MAEKQVKKQFKFTVGEKFEDLSTFSNYEGLGEDNFKALERGEGITLDEVTPEIEALIKGKKIISK